MSVAAVLAVMPLSIASGARLVTMPFIPAVTMATVAAIIQNAGSVSTSRAEIGALAISARARSRRLLPRHRD